jgi:hypothetical protein
VSMSRWACSKGGWGAGEGEEGERREEEKRATKRGARARERRAEATAAARPHERRRRRQQGARREQGTAPPSPRRGFETHDRVQSMDPTAARAIRGAGGNAARAPRAWRDESTAAHREQGTAAGGEEATASLSLALQPIAHLGVLGRRACSVWIRVFRN